MAKPWSKVLELKAPDGTVTDPCTVTVLPNGRLRASPILIGWLAGGAASGAARPVNGIKVSVSASRTAYTRRRLRNRCASMGFLLIPTPLTDLDDFAGEGVGWWSARRTRIGWILVEWEEAQPELPRDGLAPVAGALQDYVHTTNGAQVAATIKREVEQYCFDALIAILLPGSLLVAEVEGRLRRTCTKKCAVFLQRPQALGAAALLDQIGADTT